MSVTVVGSLLDALPGLVAEAAAIRHESADRILAGSQGNAAQVTGALKASHYRVDERGSTYAQATAAALDSIGKVGQLRGVVLLAPAAWLDYLDSDEKAWIPIEQPSDGTIRDMHALVDHVTVERIMGLDSLDDATRARVLARWPQ